jgi:tetratricopeptide (TPR) repeat protein
MSAVSMAALVFLAAGCASYDVRFAESLQPHVNLVETPFHPQLDHHCGPAALMTVLEASDINPDYQDVVEQIYVPDLEGSLQVEIMAAARGFGRIPFRVGRTLNNVLAEIEAGHPVLILQNLGVRSLPAWHYAVAVGFDREEQVILMRSGTQREMRTPVKQWMRQWDWAGRWGVVVLAPGQLPAKAGPASVMRALADFDEHGSSQARYRAWDAAARRWPETALAHMGIGNAQYAMGDPEAAEESFRRALRIRPDHWPARLNLAQVLFELQRPCDGLRVVEAGNSAIDESLSGVHRELASGLEAACFGNQDSNP